MLTLQLCARHSAKRKLFRAAAEIRHACIATDLMVAITNSGGGGYGMKYKGSSIAAVPRGSSVANADVRPPQINFSSLLAG